MLRVFVICLFLVASSSLSLREHLLGFSAQVELQRHNQLRARHGVGKLILDGSLSSIAQSYAIKLAATRKFAHSGAKGLGENLYWTSGIYNSPSATNVWYNEISLYNYKNPGFSSATGHFTQVVWRSTTKVGFGFSGGYVVANYSPPGNFLGQFPQNVLPRRR